MSACAPSSPLATSCCATTSSTSPLAGRSTRRADETQHRQRRWRRGSRRAGWPRRRGARGGVLRRAAVAGRCGRRSCARRLARYRRRRRGRGLRCARARRHASAHPGCLPPRRRIDGAMIELLYFDGCPNHEPVAARLPQLLERAGVAAEIEFRRVESDEDAQRTRFLGSPTVRVDGRDVEPGADERADYGLKCRLYHLGDTLTATPPDAWILAALDHPTSGLARLRQQAVRQRLESASPGA